MNRRAMFAGVVVALLLTATCASAEGGGVRVARAVGGSAPRVGHAWTLKLRVRPASFGGVVRVAASGPARLSVRATGSHGRYRARLVFPKAGRWRLAAQVSGSRAALGSVRVLAPAPLVLDQPTGIAARPDGSLLVVAFLDRRLVHVVPSTGRVNPVASFSKPWGVARGPSGSVFVSDANTVKRIDPGRAPVTVVSVDPSLEIGPVAVTAVGDLVYTTASVLYLLTGGKAGAPNQLAVGLGLKSPHGLVQAGDGSLLISDTANGRILRVAGDEATTFATLASPRGIAVAPDGTVYVASGGEHRIVHYSAAGVRLGVVGPRFGDAYALTVASDGTVYATDLGGRGIVRRIAPNGTASVIEAP